uniref:Solute carrier family 16 member 14 n=1 Tax=Canis lupus familiaris TaxID=9615 RepID=A0A8C0TJW0_CANLF
MGQLPQHGHHFDCGTFHWLVYQHLWVSRDCHHRRAGELTGLGTERLCRKRALSLYYLWSDSWLGQRDGLPAGRGHGGQVLPEETRAGAGPQHHRDGVRHVPHDAAAQAPVRGVRLARRDVHPGRRVLEPVRVRRAPEAPGGARGPRGPGRGGAGSPAGAGAGAGGRGARGAGGGAPGRPRGPQDGRPAGQEGPQGLPRLVLGLLRDRLALHQPEVCRLHSLGFVRLQQLCHPLHPPPGDSPFVPLVRAKRRVPSDLHHSHSAHPRKSDPGRRGRPALHPRVERLPDGQLTLVLSIFILPLMHTYAGLAVICALIGFSSGYFSLMPVVTEDLVGIEHLANAYGIIICANGISALLGPPFAGWIYDITEKYDFSFYICGLLYMVGILFLLIQPCIQMIEQSRKKYLDGAHV